MTETKWTLHLTDIGPVTVVYHICNEDKSDVKDQILFTPTPKHCGRQMDRIERLYLCFRT